MTTETELENLFAEIAIPDRRPMREYCLDNISLPNPPYAIPGELDLSLSPYLIEPLEQLANNDRVREVIFCGSPRLGKSLISDAYIMYRLKEDPTDILIAFHTKDVLKAYYDLRFLRTLKHNKIFDLEIMERFDATQKLIKLANGSVRLISVANQNSITALGCNVSVSDECWRYPPGTISQLKTRSIDFLYSRKMLFISSGCDEGHEFHSEWLQGHQAWWGFKCEYCGVEQKYYLNYRLKDGTRAGLTFDTNDLTKPNGIRDVTATEKTAHYKCISCRAVFKDDAIDRPKLLKSGLYIPENSKAPEDIRSYQCPSIAKIPFAKIVREFLTAKHERKRGKGESYRVFWMQTMAAFWSENLGREEYQLKVGQVEDGETKGTVIRFLACDVMQDGNLLYYVICEFNKELKSIKLITYGKTDGFSALQKIWRDNQVKDQNVLIDSGDATRMVYRECARRGHLDAKKRWFCPTATKGEKPKDGHYYNPVTKKNTFFSRPKMQDGNVGLPTGEKLFCPFITFSANTAKDILASLLAGGHPDFKLFMTDEALKDEDFKAQLNSEHKEVKNGESTWVPNKEKIDNHYWDCLVLVMVAGGICGYL